MTRGRRATIAVVVPALGGTGGVPAVARFVRDAVVESGEFNLKLVSLAGSATDPSSVRLSRPGTWLRGISTSEGIWEGSTYTHVGVFATELEFQRYRPRAPLERVLAESDLIQVVSGGPSWALSVTGLNKPVALAVASRTVLERRRREAVEHGVVAKWRQMMTRITARLDDLAVRKSDAVLVMNPSMFEYASRITAGRGASIRYAPPGVDTDVFRPAADGVRGGRGPRYVLSVGRFDDPRKNVDLLLEAFAAVRQRTPQPLHLRLAGAAGPGPPFWQRVEALDLAGAVSFDQGLSREELVDLYRNALCFALASDEEGFGVVVIEAMACGVPVVATRCGGPDGIITDGVDGYLVARGNAGELADRLGRLTSDWVANDRMGVNARKKVERSFSQDIAGEVYLDTYRRLLDAKSRNT